MTINELKIYLEKQYTLICFEDLAKYYTSQGAIFHLLDRLHKTEFLPNERLVFYSSYLPEQAFLNHIQRAVSKVDISNFFILFVTPFEIANNLVESNRLFGYDSVAISSNKVDIRTTIKFGNPGFIEHYDTICAMPFMRLDVSMKNVTPCCKFNGTLGKADGTPLIQIFNGQQSQALRQQIKNGIKPRECSSCWRSESHQQSSLRKHSLDKYVNLLDRYFFDRPELKKLAIFPTNSCNFSCRICSIENSSSIAAEEFKYAKSADRRQYAKTFIDLSKSIKIKNNQIDTLLTECADYIDELYIAGGETFNWPGLVPLLQTIINQGRAKNIKIDFNTNGSVFPSLALTLLKQFKYTEILISIDDVGPRFEIQRGGKWQDVYQNILQFKELKTSTFNIKISPTINIQNLLYLDQLEQFCRDLELDIVWNYLQDPEYLSIDCITQKAKDLVYQKYCNHREPELRNLADNINNTKPVTGAKFLEYMHLLDQRRNQDFSITHKEIFDAMSV